MTNRLGWSGWCHIPDHDTMTARGEGQVEWFMDSWTCHRIVYLLVKNPQGIELERLRLLFYESANSPYYNHPNQFKDCLGNLVRNNMVEVQKIMSEDLQKCVKEVEESGDRRIKNPVKYCLKRGRGTVVNMVRATRELCLLFRNHLESQRYIIKKPEFKC